MKILFLIILNLFLFREQIFTLTFNHGPPICVYDEHGIVAINKSYIEEGANCYREINVSRFNIDDVPKSLVRKFYTID